MRADLGPIKVERRDGKQRFHSNGDDLPFDVRSFWEWSCSDLVSNATRGVLAEYIVAQAFGVAYGQVREEWAAYDLLTKERIKVEVKSAAYIQSWAQREPSRISFLVPKTLAWDKETNLQEKVAKRQADVYVFALLAHTEQSSLDPLDLSQWKFYVVPTRVLDERERSQHSITLTSLRNLAGASVGFSKLRDAVVRARGQRRGTGIDEPEAG
jgi:hypothetical protein